MKETALKTLIRNGTVVTPQGVQQSDLLLDNGRITAVGRGLAADGAAIMDASGKILLPGGIDVHTHVTLNPDTAAGDVYYTGTRAALMGGTTSIVEHLGFTPAGRSPTRQLALYAELAAGQAAADYGFHGLVQSGDADSVKNLETFAAQGVTTVKAYMTYARHLDDAALSAMLRHCRDLGLLTAVHAEDHQCVQNGIAACKAEKHGGPIWHARSRPPECEARAVARLLRLAAAAGNAPVYIVHLSTAAALAEIRKAREGGQKNIFVETCTQYLILAEDRYEDPVMGLRYIMSPPLRRREDVEALWQGLAKGDIQTVATDHCAFSLADKNRGLGDFTRCPGGAPGIEERFSLIFSQGVAKGRISLERFAEVMAGNPARLMGLYPRKGALAPGSDADIVILDPHARRTVHAHDLHGSWDYSLYENMDVLCGIDTVFLRGCRVVDNGRFTGARGQGSFLRRDRFMEAR